MTILDCNQVGIMHCVTIAAIGSKEVLGLAVWGAVEGNNLASTDLWPSEGLQTLSHRLVPLTISDCIKK